MRLKYKCPFDKDDKGKPCNRGFYKEHNLITHVLFEHEKHLESLNLSKSQLKLIVKFREYKTQLSTVRTQLKKRFLQSMYGKKHNLKDETQTMLFEHNLEKYHNGEFSRIKYIEHNLYDKHYAQCLSILQKMETKYLLVG